MRLENQQVRLSASDLAKHLACRHLTFLDLLAARGELERPYRHDPSVDVLIERGLRHEAAYLAYLKGQGHELLADEDGLDNDTRFQRTLDAIRAGAAVIAQADLKDGRWYGRADVLLKVDKPSDLGGWSYEVVDTKLAKETRGGTVLQLALYSDLLGVVQGALPELFHVVTPDPSAPVQTFRLQDYSAYFRLVRNRLELTTQQESEAVATANYPEPVVHCDVCRWWSVCDKKRHADD